MWYGKTTDWIASLVALNVYVEFACFPRTILPFIRI